MTFRWLALLLGAAFACETTAAPITLPIYIEDSHAGSFHWLARHLDLDAEYTLVHFDAHSDASGIFDSDKLRERLRRVGSVEERREVLDQWRRTGLIQCYNWIEPLMPAPISRAFWVPAATVPKRRATELEEKAVRQLDGHLEAAPRAAPSFRGRYRVVGFDQLSAQLKETGPVVVTIDLDYFAGMPADRRAQEFERVWKFVAECRNLHAVTIAISRAYLKSEDEADELVRLALAASLSLPTATIQFEPFEKVGNDRSLRAEELRSQKKEVPAFTLLNASEKLRALLLANRDRIAVGTEAAAWEKILGEWEKAAPRVRLALKDREPSTDNIWRLPVSEAGELELRTEPWDTAIQRVEWIALTPEYLRCDVAANRGGEIDFAKGAPPRPRWRETILAGRKRTLAIDSLRNFLDRKTESGALRLKARVSIDGRIRETPAIEIRRFAGSGFRAAITEQFGLPYLFGSGELRDGPNTGPETGWGADCANFVVYAFRRQGRAIPWSNPKQLRKYLEPLGQNVRTGDATVSEQDIAGGLIVHLGSHVAAVMEDRPPAGILDSSDLVAHQLEGVPEMLSLGQLLAARKTDRFDLLRAPPPPQETDLLLGGDVMLGRTVGDQIKNGADPLAGIRRRLEGASWKVVNLECVVSDLGTAAGKRYSLRAPLEAIRVLADARINAVSLANNHAADFGQEGLLDSIARLRASEIAAIGAADTLEGAYAPHFFTTRDGSKGAVIALSDFEAKDAPIASTGQRERVARAIAEARGKAAFILCLVHWGDENTDKVTERQRELARWLIDHDVDAVVGSHSHCIQPMDFYHGRPIVYSLGNLVFDGAPSLPSWKKGQLLEISLAPAQTRQASLRLIPVQLDARGFPQMAEPEEIKERRFTNRRQE
ncbi:MAG TPA: CapA family protein [Chthoniobacterales bacterium]|nr:CapA family protein [Chthoniobacterales bacterium]